MQIIVWYFFLLVRKSRTCLYTHKMHAENSSPPPRSHDVAIWMPGEEASCRHPSKSSIVFLPFQQKKEGEEENRHSAQNNIPTFPPKRLGR